MTEKQQKSILSNYIANKIIISEEEKRQIEDAYSILEVKKKKYFFEQGSVCQYEGFVLKGTFRIYYVDLKGIEHVLYFAFNNWWVGDIASFNSGEISGLNAQALEDGTLLVIDKKRKEELFQKIPALERLFRIILQNHLTVLQKRFLLTISSSAAERYLELIERSPGIEQLVPQHQIASYLGILPESLSRMKKKMREDL
jgi:CRP-like cAMP-binding protein